MARRTRYGPNKSDFIIAKRNYNFVAQVTDFVADTDKRLTALTRQSTQILINDYLQKPVAKGGKMRVDTGFLRKSGTISFSGMPSGPVRGDPKQKYTFKPVAIADFAAWKIGQTLYFGWTAGYARVREAYDGFLISGVQQWQSIVDRVCVEIRQRSESRTKK